MQFSYNAILLSEQQIIEVEGYVGEKIIFAVENPYHIDF